jgi:hypothetical protein
MQFLDYEDDGTNPPDPATNGGKHRIKFAERAQKHKDEVLRLIGNLSVKPQDYVIGYDYVEQDDFTARALRLCAFRERTTYEYRMRQIFDRSFTKSMFGEESLFTHQLDLESFPHGLRELPSFPAIYFCCEAINMEPFELWYIGKTQNLNARWKNHHKFNPLKAVGVDEIRYQNVSDLSDADINILERLYITMYFPKFNDRQIVGFNPNDVTQSHYHQGFNDGYEKAVQDAQDYYSKEINALHSRIFRLQGGIS